MWYSLYSQPGCTGTFVSWCSLSGDSARAAAQRLPRTGRMQTAKEEIPLQLIKEHSARACKMRRGKWIQCQWEQVLEEKQWYFRGGSERAVNLFSDSGLTFISESLDCCYQSVERRGRVPSSSKKIQSCWMGSTWAALWMDLWHSVEIFTHSLLASLR